MQCEFKDNSRTDKAPDKPGQAVARKPQNPKRRKESFKGAKKKKLDEAVKLVGDITTKNTNIKMDLQVQKDLVMALRLKHNDEPTYHKEDTTTWCKHIHNCLQGRFCVLRKEGEKDFANLLSHRRH